MRTEHDELKALEQWLPHSVGEDENDDEENERTRQGLNNQLDPTLGQESPNGSPVPTLTDPMNRQLKAELERVWLQLNAAEGLLEREETVRQDEMRQRVYYRNANEKLATLLENYKAAVSTLHHPGEEEEWRNLSARIADPDAPEILGDERNLAEELEGEEDEDTAPPEVYYSSQDVEELQKEWQETYQQEIIELQCTMQSQLNAQAAKARAQPSLGTTVQHPIGMAEPTGPSRLSTNAPAFVPGQTLGMGMTFYNSTPRPDDHTQPAGLVSRMTERADPVNVYTTFEKPKSVFRAGYGDHRIANPVVRTGPEEHMQIPDEEEFDEGMIMAIKSL